MDLPIGPGGDTTHAVSLWRRTNMCTDDMPRGDQINGHGCKIWSACADETIVVLCLHDRGHIVPEGWIENALRRALSKS